MAATLLPGADLLVRRLRDHGVQHVFGYPGGQLTPIYDALARDGGIRHVLARDEQAAAFMADGYARATGKPGVALAVCGPGVYNAFTPLATAFTDSIPLLLISGQIAGGRSLRSGYYHENEQLHAAATLTKHRVRSQSAATLLSDLDGCFRAMSEGRPGPAFLEVPVDVQRAQAVAEPWPALPPRQEPPSPSRQDVEALARLLTGWKRPLLLAGGGVISANAAGPLAELAHRLGAPVFHSFMGKGAFPGDDPLCAGLPWSRATSDLTDMERWISPLFAQADGLLAVGCRFSQACTATWQLKPPPNLAQIDIDPAELGRHYPVTLGIAADARMTLRALLEVLPTKTRQPWTMPQPPDEPWRLPGLDLVAPLRRALRRDAIVVADITRLAYILLAEFPAYKPRSFLHPAGFVSMGFGIPAALGAKVAFPERPVVAIAGDGCFLMSAMELATAVQEKLPIVVVLINDGSLTLIKAIQDRRYQGRHLGVDLRNPDFQRLAQAFGLRCWQVDSEAAFARALQEALNAAEPALVEVRVR